LLWRTQVIRALYDYEANSAQELSFSKGDFFHVIGRENDTDWYEACNPAVPDARGLVPVAFFQALGKTERDSAQSDVSSASTKIPDHDSGYSEATGAGEGMRMSKSMGKGSGAMVYGIVMYDFAAERPDELDAKQGEAIIVIAQSNPEWFVAKPIGRLGGPGLIPVSFIEIRDMSSGAAVPDAQQAVQRAGVPKVEEWKKMAADYKNSSITLGKFEVPNSQQQNLEQGMERMSLQKQQGRQSSSNGQTVSFTWLSGRRRIGTDNKQQVRQSSSRGNQAPQQPVQDPYTQNTELFAPISAHIPRFCFAEEKYWFVIEAELEDGRFWELSRFYEDFYDFQIALLTAFPAEAGNTGTQKRTLPYMPGPVNYVTDAITDGRRHNLDSYVKNLLSQPPYIARCELVKQFFKPREGDFEIDPNAVGEEYRTSGGTQSSSGEPMNDMDMGRQTSISNMNGNGYGLSAPPAHQQQQGHQRTMSNMSATQSQNYRPAEPPRQTSTMSQATTNLASPQPLSAMKVKIYFGDDLIAIRVPTDTTFLQLYDKIRDRLKIPPNEEILLNYKDESSGERPAMVNDDDLDFALNRNARLVLYVEIA
jgi:bud emergence protein 1